MPGKDSILHFETKSLRDTRHLLNTVPNIEDAYSFVEDNSHPRLWNILAEHALEKLEFVIADKAFVRSSNYHGIQFVKSLQKLDDQRKQQAEVAKYFQRFEVRVWPKLVSIVGDTNLVLPWNRKRRASTMRLTDLTWPSSLECS